MIKADRQSSLEIQVNVSYQLKTFPAKLIITPEKTIISSNEIVIEVVYSFSNKFQLFYPKLQDLKNSQLLEPLLIRIFLKQSLVEIKASVDELKLIRKVLSQYLNQKGFYENVKPYKKLGKGNFGSVYLVKRLDDGRPMAAKAFLKFNLSSIQFGEHILENQVLIMRTLDHPNILKLIQIYQTEHSVYLCVERMEGDTLERFIFKRQYSLDDVQVIIKQLLQALAYMHAKGFMHRDIKPNNILFKQPGSLQIVLIDFGLSTKIQVDHFIFPRCGTPGYVAPQVINMQNLTEKYSEVCDVFSLGLIFYELIARKPAFIPHQDKNMLKVNKKCSIDFDVIDKSVGAQALELLHKMLDKNPATRITAKQALKHRYFKKANLMGIQFGQAKSTQKKQIVQKQQLLLQLPAKEKEQLAEHTTNYSRASLKEETKRQRKIEIKDSIGNFVTFQTQSINSNSTECILQHKSKQPIKLKSGPMKPIKQIKQEDQNPLVKSKIAIAKREETKAQTYSKSKQLIKLNNSLCSKHFSLGRTGISKIYGQKREQKTQHAVFRGEVRNSKRYMVTVPEGDSTFIQILASNPRVIVRQL